MIKNRETSICSGIYLLLLMLLTLINCSEKNRWQSAKKKNTIQACEEFLRQYPDGEFAKKAQAKIMLIKFQTAEKEDSVKAFQLFLKNYPDDKGWMQRRAKNKLEKLLFRDAKSKDSIESYEKYLQKNPSGPFVSQAIIKLIELYIKTEKKKKSAGIEKFIWEKVKSWNNSVGYVSHYLYFPGGQFSEKAKKTIFSNLEKNAKKYPQSPSLILKLRSTSALARGKAAYELGKSKTLVAIPFLVDVIGDRARLYWKKLDKRGMPVYSLGIKKKDQTSPSKEAARAIVKIGDKRVAEYLKRLLRSNEFAVRFEASKALVKLVKDEIAFKYLLEGLKHWDSVCSEAAVALGELGDKRAVKPLIAAMKEGVIQKHVAAEALGMIGDKSAVQPLIDVLWNDKRRVSLSVIKALGRIGDSKAVEPLMEILNHKNQWARKGAAGALKKITGKNFKLDYKKWREWWKTNKNSLTDQDS